MIKIIALAFMVFVQTLGAQQVSEYSVDSVPGIVNELGNPKYEKPVKEWMKNNRPAQYKAMFEKESEKPKDDSKSKEDKSTVITLLNANAAIADWEALMLDYYINAKVQEGWMVVSLTDKMILFRRDIPAKAKSAPGK